MGMQAAPAYCSCAVSTVSSVRCRVSSLLLTSPRREERFHLDRVPPHKRMITDSRSFVLLSCMHILSYTGKFTPWQIIVTTLSAVYALRNADSLLGLGCQYLSCLTEPPPPYHTHDVSTLCSSCYIPPTSCGTSHHTSYHIVQTMII